MSKLSGATLIVAGLLLASGGYADDAHHAAANIAVAQASEALSEGEVRKVDKDAKKITIKHGPLANLDMPPMTMVFQVRDPDLLDQAKAGDKVRFRAEKQGSAYVVTEIRPAK